MRTGDAAPRPAATILMTPVAEMVPLDGRVWGQEGSGDVCSHMTADRTVGAVGGPAGEWGSH